MWQNKAASFGNCSQNYSQIAIAAHLILNDLIYENCDIKSRMYKRAKTIQILLTMNLHNA